MGDYFEANLDSKLRSKAVGKVRFQTITPAADLDTMAEPIITEDATTVYTPSSDTSEDLSGASSDSSDSYSSHEETEEISLPISQNPEPITEPKPQNSGFLAAWTFGDPLRVHHRPRDRLPAAIILTMAVDLLRRCH